MIADARTAGLTDRIETDVAIVGSGPAGITLALELAKAGIDVVLVEAGGRRFSRKEQNFYAAEGITPETHGPVDMFRRRVLGGSSTVWGGRCIPFDPVDFETRPWMRHARWPIRYDDVAQYYARACAYAEAGAPLFDATHALPGEPPAIVPGVTSPDAVLDRIERFSHPTDFARWYAEPLQGSPNIRLFTHAPVEQILTSDGGHRATGVRLRIATGDGQGRRVIVAATRVVVAAGGLETVRLLLASNEARACGLGNERDLVGRFYQCHLEGEIGTITFTGPQVDTRLNYSRAPDRTWCRRYLWLSPEAQWREALAGLVLRPSHPNIVDPEHGHPVLSAMYLVKNLIVAEYARKMTSLEAVARAKFDGGAWRFYAAHLRNVLAGAPRLAQFGAMWTRHRILARRKLPSVVLADPRGIYPIDINAEQEPNPDSRVTLGHARDALGMRRLVIDWQTTADDHDRLARGMRLMQAALAPSGTARIDLGADFEACVARRVPVGGHHVGTARMATDRSEGVCDANAEVFGTRGLYIAGAACMPTSGFANPTLMLLALTLRLSEHLRATLATGNRREGPSTRLEPNPPNSPVMMDAFAVAKAALPV